MSNDSEVNVNNYFSLSSSSSSDDDSFHSTRFLSLNETLKSNFSDVAKKFNVIHINAQSIPAHYPDMLTSFECKNIHAILVSESWLKPCLPSTCYALPGFQLIRNDRIGKGGGGVAIYLKSHFSFNIVASSPQPLLEDSIEYLLLEVQLSHTKILLGVFYSSSSQIDYFSQFEVLLDTYIPSYNHNIIMGDFNTCLIKANARANKLKYILDSCNLRVLSNAATHFAPDCIPSLLDLMMVSQPDYVAKFGQCSADAFSHHHLIFLSYNIRVHKPKPTIVLQRNFSGMDTNSLCSDAHLIDWTEIVNESSVHRKVELFNSVITQLYDKHAPLRPVKIKHLPAPWLTNDLKIYLDKKHRARAKYKANNTEENRIKYVRIRNRCNTMCRDAQRRHIHSSVQNGDPAKIWKFLRSLGVGNSTTPFIPQNFNLDTLNKYFSSFATINDSKKLSTLQNLSTLPTPEFSPFIFKEFSDCEVKKNILAVSSNAVGVDNISRNMIIPILDIVIPTLTHIFNHSIASRTFPNIWKDAFVIPLPKKTNPSLFSDYRPISILPFLSKVLERLVHQQFRSFLCSNNLFNEFQSGFRPGHSTTTALVKISDDIRQAMDSRKLTVLALLDFKNAFNSVDYDIFLSLLRSINMSPLALGWFRSYLDGRRQRIRWANVLSDWSCITAGVPQGGVLSPLLFSFFISSITHKLSSLYHMYADDLQIYAHTTFEELHRAIDKINADLATICNWSKDFGLNLNPNKSQVIIIGSPKLIAKVDWSALPAVTLNGINIPFTDCVKI